MDEGRRAALKAMLGSLGAVAMSMVGRGVQAHIPLPDPEESQADTVKRPDSGNCAKCGTKLYYFVGPSVVCFACGHEGEPTPYLEGHKGVNFLYPFEDDPSLRSAGWTSESPKEHWNPIDDIDPFEDVYHRNFRIIWHRVPEVKKNSPSTVHHHLSKLWEDEKYTYCFWAEVYGDFDGKVKRERYHGQGIPNDDYVTTRLFRIFKFEEMTQFSLASTGSRVRVPSLTWANGHDYTVLPREVPNFLEVSKVIKRDLAGRYPNGVGVNCMFLNAACEPLIWVGELPDRKPISVYENLKNNSGVEQR